MDNSKSTSLNPVATVIQGGIVGIGNIIPGVSGGTLALILGIYPRVIGAIHSVNTQTIQVLLSWLWSPKQKWDDLKAEWQRCDFTFLILLGVGAILAIYGLSWVIPKLLNDHRSATLAFFLGLILISTIFPYRLIKEKSWREFVMVGLGIATIVLIPIPHESWSKEAKEEAKAAKVQVEQAADAPKSYSAEKLGFFFVAGAIAISTMILPGISGSLMLLLMGIYFDVLSAIKSFDVVLVGVFALGCGIGLALFSRFLHFVLEKYHDPTMGYLTGLIIGSLYAIWPYKMVVTEGGASYVKNTLPEMTFQSAGLPLITFVIGCAIVVVFYVFELRKEKGKAQA